MRRKKSREADCGRLCPENGILSLTGELYKGDQFKLSSSCLNFDNNVPYSINLILLTFPWEWHIIKTLMHLPTHTSKFPCVLLFCSQNCFLLYLLSKTINLKWKNEEFKQLHMKWWFVMTNPESVYVVNLFLKIQCTLKQIMKFIFQILFLQNKSPQFYFSPSLPCFTILKFLSSFFHCLGLKSTESWNSAGCECAAEPGPYERRLHRTFLSHTSVLQKNRSTFPLLEHHECHSTM